LFPPLRRQHQTAQQSLSDDAIAAITAHQAQVLCWDGRSLGLLQIFHGTVAVSPIADNREPPSPTEARCRCRYRHRHDFLNGKGSHSHRGKLRWRCSRNARLELSCRKTSSRHPRQGDDGRNGPLTDAPKIIDRRCSRTHQKLRDFVRDVEKLIGAIRCIVNASARLAREERQQSWKSSYGFPHLPFHWCKARFSLERDAE